ncbi:MAG: hypothetical protein U5K81_13525 [Trueperaceae bacterium]|nr:hypothetical protein [Trueperaceae bacterium]
MPATSKKNLHVPLPPELHSALKEQSNRLRTPATTLAREAIEEWIRLRKREQVAQELRAYADEMAGTDADVDPAWEDAGVDSWLENDP